MLCWIITKTVIYKVLSKTLDTKKKLFSDKNPLAQNVLCDCSELQQTTFFLEIEDHSMKKNFPLDPRVRGGHLFCCLKKIFSTRWSLRAQICSHRELKCYHLSPTELARNRINHFSPLIFSKIRPVTQTVLLPFSEAYCGHNPSAIIYWITLIALLLLYHPSCEEMSAAVNLSVVHLSPKWWTNGVSSSCTSLHEKKKKRGIISVEHWK